MNATELFLKDGKSAGIFFCGECRRVAPTQDIAVDCCQTYRCRECGKDTGAHHYTVCEDCRRKARDAKEAERFAKAEKLTAWDGWVYCEGRGFQDGFFPTLGDLMDDLDDDTEGDEAPAITYAWTCQPTQFVRASLSDITERVADEAYEDFDVDELAGLKELSDAIVKFNKANEDRVSYAPDYAKAVLLNDKLTDSRP